MSLVYEGLGNCPECADSPTGICDTCRADLADSEAETWAEGRRGT